MTMKALTQAARAICLVTAAETDIARRAKDPAERAAAANRVALLTPVAKAFSTDIGCEVASIGVQVHGGMGFIEETGAAQIYRDARILPIYEGTNGIQAIDLVTRKLPLEGGKVVAAYIGELQKTVEEVRASNRPEFGRMGERLGEAVAALAEASRWMGASLQNNPEAAMAGATPYLRLFGLAAGGVYLARGALAAARDGGQASQAQPIALARFFAENIATAATGLKDTVVGGADSTLMLRRRRCRREARVGQPKRVTRGSRHVSAVAHPTVLIEGHGSNDYRVHQRACTTTTSTAASRSSRSRTALSASRNSAGTPRTRGGWTLVSDNPRGSSPTERAHRPSPPPDERSSGCAIGEMRFGQGRRDARTWHSSDPMTLTRSRGRWTAWHRMVDARDLSEVASLCAPEAVFRSPVALRALRGAAGRAFLQQAMQVFSDFAYHRTFIAGDHSVVLEFSARVGDKTLKGIDMIRFDADGRMTEFEVMVRPATGLQALGRRDGPPHDADPAPRDKGPSATLTARVATVPHLA